MPIDINWLRTDKGGDPEKWREYQARRFKDPALLDQVMEIDQVCGLPYPTLRLPYPTLTLPYPTLPSHPTPCPPTHPQTWRNLMTQMNDEKKVIGKLGREVATAKKAKDEATAGPLIAKMAELKASLPDLMGKIAEAEAKRDALVNLLGNEVAPDVVISKNEDLNVTVRTWGDHGAHVGDLGDAEPKFHHQLLDMIGGFESDRGVRVAGHRGYFLTGPGLQLNIALINYALDFLRRVDYTVVQPPYFMMQSAMARVAQLADFDEQLYKVTSSSESAEDMYLIATSEQPMCVFHAGERLADADLPKRYGAWSSCFRKEAGSHGRDTWGIFRVHQFDKIEQFVYCKPEESWAFHEEMIARAEAFYQSLGLSYRVINLVSGELNDAAAKKYDLEAWFPGYKEYKELVSCSNCTDFQARAMDVRYGYGKDAAGEKQYVHMLNSTLCATTRTICAILENYQTADGVVVPEVLRPYCGGVDFFPFVRESTVGGEAVAAKEGKKAGGKAQAKKGEGKKADAKKEGAGAAAPAPAKGAAKPAKAAAKDGKKETKPAAAAAAAAKPAKAAGDAKKAGKPAGAGTAGPRPTLATNAGMSALNGKLAAASYVAGFVPSAEDAAVFALVNSVLAEQRAAAPDAVKYPHVARWWRHVHSFTPAERAEWPATKAQAAAAGAVVSTLFTL